MSLIVVTAVLASFLMAMPAPKASAVAKQPAGEFPITEPLQPLQPGIQPNYSNSVQDDEHTPANLIDGIPADSDSESGSATNPSGQPMIESGTPAAAQTPAAQQSKKWYVLLVIVVIGIVARLVYWRRKINRTGASLVIAGLLMATFSILGLSLGSSPAFAQTPPQQRLPIQRVIEEENPDGLTASQVASQGATSSANNDTRAGQTVLFGLAAVFLIIVAIGIAVMYWKKSTPAPHK